ncbi:response regulator transcription factor [Brooklawnia cerclae]|uniref:DNA-binding NarL/FixJ family response regulator n=1 Tax=Brooklawnia cerclae TaxID=349934 RepID=A0ABX0SGZ7_9ACTN|nr:response regulator transcription factor [Brooklawnia cerclae]NIH55972.1 DNA-binding NarL/FixJ family response regulator [Brooklawnia cerclae]
MPDDVTAPAPIRVLLVDDQQLVRTGFRMILSVSDDVEVVGEAGNGVDAVEQVARLAPDVVLMDVQMPGMDGIEATRQVARTTRVVILTTFDRDDYLFDALDAGASGFLLKNAGPEMLVEAVHAVARGHALLSPEVTTRVIAQMARPAGSVPASSARGRPTGPAGAELTERETEVLVQMAYGLSNAEIAAELVVGEATVKTHVSNILTKLGLRDRVQAVAWAYRSGLLR